MKLRNRDLFLLIVIGILSIALMFKQCSEPQVITKTKDIYKYKTDTVYVNKDYKEKYEEIVKLYNKKSKVTPPKDILSCSSTGIIEIRRWRMYWIQAITIYKEKNNINGKKQSKKG